jgi:serine/threonine protein kinase
LREAKIHARLQHPHIASFYHAARLEGQLVMTSEWVEGRTLAEMLREGALPTDKATDLFRQALAAFAYAHREGVVHRDITPEHLVLTRDGTVKVTGFGLAKKSTDLQLTQPGMVLGSVYYMSPEQVRGSVDIDYRADIYSLGVVLFEAVTGRPPFDSKSHYEVFLGHVNNDAPRPSQLRPEVPPALDDVILRALAKHPLSRFQSAEEFLAALEHFQNSLGRLQDAVAATSETESKKAAGPLGPAAEHDGEPATVREPAATTPTRREDDSGHSQPAAGQEPASRERARVPVLLKPKEEQAASAEHSPGALVSDVQSSDSPFAGWTSGDIVAVGSLTFVIVAAVFFVLLTFLNR